MLMMRQRGKPRADSESATAEVRLLGSGHRLEMQMPKRDDDLKRRTRERMAITGERYTQARVVLLERKMRSWGAPGSVQFHATVGRSIRDARLCRRLTVAEAA